MIADWDIHGPSDRVWTPEELAQIARAAQAFQVALPTAGGATFHLVTLHGLGVIDGGAEVTGPQPGESTAPGICDSCQTEQAVIDGIVVAHNFERDGQRHRCSGSGRAPSKARV